MASVLIHIGVGKTGTTYLQHALAASRESLRPINYPKIGRGPSHNHLMLLYPPYEKLPRGLVMRFTDPDEREEMKNSVRSNLRAAFEGDTPILLSGEYFSEMTDEEVAAFIADLRAYGASRIGVICYIREPSSLYLSRVQQSLKYSHEYPNPFTVQYDFLNVVQRWEAVADGGMIVRPYDRRQLVDGDILTDFFGQVREFFEVDFDLKANPSETNESMHVEAMILLRDMALEQMNASEPDDFASRGRRLSLVKRSSAKLKGHLTKPKLRPEYVAAVRKSHAGEMRLLEARYGIRFPETAAEPLSSQESSAEPDTPSLEELLVTYSEDGLERLRQDVTRRRLRVRTGLGKKTRALVSDILRSLRLIKRKI